MTLTKIGRFHIPAEIEERMTFKVMRPSTAIFLEGQIQKSFDNILVQLKAEREIAGSTIEPADITDIEFQAISEVFKKHRVIR